MDTFEIKDDEIDVEDIMRQIRENIKKRRESGAYDDDMEEIISKPLSELSDSHAENTDQDTDDNLSDDLEYINSNWDTHAEYYISSHRSIIGKFLIRGRQIVHGEVRRYVDLIVGKQTEFNVHIVRLMNKLSGKFEKQETKVSSEIESVSQSVQELDNKVSSEIESVSQNVQELDNKVSSEIESVSQNVQELDNKVSSEIESVSQNVQELDNKVNSEIQSVSKNVQELDNKVSSEIQSVSKNVQELDNEVSSEIESVSKNVQELDNKVSSEIQSVSKNVQELDNKVSSEIQSVSQNVGDLKNEITTVIEEKVMNVFETINMDIENKAWLASLLEKRIELHKQSLLNDIDESDNDINYFVFNEYIGKAWSKLSGDSVIDVPNVFEKSLELFNECKNVLEIGCGNGTFLQMLEDKDIRGYGIDINEDFILYCKRKDLNVENVDVITHLKSLPDKTIDGVFSAHVIEHLQTHELIKLIELCYAKMEFGSYIVLVTPNILNIIVSSNTFYMDPTHINHIHPDVLKYLLESGGFRDVQKILYQEVPDELKLKEINCDVDQTIEDIKIFETLNYNINILNNLLFGYRDFAIFAKK